MTSSRKWIFAAGLTVFGLAMFPTALFAATAVTFADADLGAFVQLVKPEQTTIRLDGRTGQFSPGASLQFAGLEPQTFDIDLNLGADLVDLHFNNLRAKTPTVHFETDRIRLDIAFEDQTKAIRSILGAISLRGVTISAWVRFAADGSTRITYDSGAITGEVKGTGFLGARWIIDAIKKVALKALKSQLETQLGRANVEASVEKGFITWAKFSADDRLARVTPGTVKVSPTGIQFQAE